MAFHATNPVRDQIRSEILSALANASEPMTTGALYDVCPSASSAQDVGRLAWDLMRKGMIADAGKVPHPRGSPVNSYVLATDPRIEAAKPIKAEAKIKPTRQPAIKRKSLADHPFQAPISHKAPHDAFPAVSPVAQTTTAPQMVAEGINNYLLVETAMSEDPLQYIPDPDAFTLEPKEPESEEDIDSDLVDALLELAHLEPKDQAVDDVLAMASADVGEIAAAMSKRHESAPKVCQCLRINSLPRLPKGYVYGGIKVWIESEHDVGRLTIATHDEGGGAFASIKASGRLSFDPGDLVAIGQVADALIRLHEAMEA